MEDEIIQVPELDEHGVPVGQGPARKWLAWLLSLAAFGSGIGQMYWTVSIATTQMVGVYTRWKTDHNLPLAPTYFAWVTGIGAAIWIGRNRDRYSKAERTLLYTAIILALLISAIGFMILTLKEPYHDGGGAG